MLTLAVWGCILLLSPSGARAEPPAFDQAWWAQQCPNNPLVPRQATGAIADARTHFLRGDLAQARAAFKNYATTCDARAFDAVPWLKHCDAALAETPSFPAPWTDAGGALREDQTWRLHVCRLRSARALAWGVGPQAVHPSTAFRQFDARISQHVMRHAATAVDGVGGEDPTTQAWKAYWTQVYGQGGEARCFEDCLQRLHQDCPLWNACRSLEKSVHPPLWCDSAVVSAGPTNFERTLSSWSSPELEAERLAARTDRDAAGEMHLLEPGEDRAAPRGQLDRWPTGHVVDTPQDVRDGRRAVSLSMRQHESRDPQRASPEPQGTTPSPRELAEYLWFQGVRLEPITQPWVEASGSGLRIHAMTQGSCVVGADKRRRLRAGPRTGPCLHELLQTQDQPVTDEEAADALDTLKRIRARALCRERVEDCVTTDGSEHALSRSQYLVLWRVQHAAYPCYGSCLLDASKRQLSELALACAPSEDKTAPGCPASLDVVVGACRDGQAIPIRFATAPEERRPSTDPDALCVADVLDVDRRIVQAKTGAEGWIRPQEVCE